MKLDVRPLERSPVVIKNQLPHPLNPAPLMGSHLDLRVARQLMRLHENDKVIDMGIIDGVGERLPAPPGLLAW